MEKARMKAERRAQKKLAGREPVEIEIEEIIAPSEPVQDPQPQT